jgi:hypothetical protein
VTDMADTLLKELRNISRKNNTRLLLLKSFASIWDYSLMLFEAIKLKSQSAFAYDKQPATPKSIYLFSFNCCGVSFI